MKALRTFLIALLATAAVAFAAAPAARADGWYAGGSYSSGSGAYWDPACGCWRYPAYSYYPTYSYAPAYTYYSYPRYYYPYYSRPAVSVGFSYGGGSRYYGGYGYRRWYR